MCLEIDITMPRQRQGPRKEKVSSHLADANAGLSSCRDGPVECFSGSPLLGPRCKDHPYREASIQILGTVSAATARLMRRTGGAEGRSGLCVLGWHKMVVLS